MTNWISDGDGYLNPETGYRVRVDKDGFYAVDLPDGSPLTWFGADSFQAGLEPVETCVVDRAPDQAGRSKCAEKDDRLVERRVEDHRVEWRGECQPARLERDGLQYPFPHAAQRCILALLGGVRCGLQSDGLHVSASDLTTVD